MARTCYIVGASGAKKVQFSRTEADLVIAADGGYVTLLGNNIKPDIIIGDFDSSPVPKDLNNVEMIKLKPEKDFTDTAEAVMIGKARGYKRFVIYGGLGGKRLSHTIANISLVAGLVKQGTDVYLAGDDMNVRVLRNGETTLEKGCRYLSVFAFEKPTRVSLSGVKYPLDGYTLIPDEPLGVSNEIVSEHAVITVHEGTLVIIEEF